MADLFTLAAKMKVACLLRFTENAGPLHLFDTFSLNALKGGFNLRNKPETCFKLRPREKTIKVPFCCL